MKPGHLDTATKKELGHINTMFYWSINLKMNVDYETTMICVQPILDSMVPYLSCVHGNISIVTTTLHAQPDKGKYLEVHKQKIDL